MNYKIGRIIIFILGILLPLSDTFITIELYCLSLPIILFFGGSFINLFLSMFKENLNHRKAIFLFSIVPIFILTQIFTTIVKDKIQQYRVDSIIKEIEDKKSQTGYYPSKYIISFGIEYIRQEDKQSYIIKYSKGFMETEEYYSKNRKWRRYPWYD